MSRIALNGVRLEVRDLGSGDAVLLLHGFTGRGVSLASLARALRRSGRRTVSIDLLGHGRSDAPTDPGRYAIDCQADDLAVLLERLEVRRADVVGYSMGARIALQLALDHPAVVRSLVLESPSAGLTDPDERRRRQASDEALAVVLERDGVAAFVDRWQAQPLFASHARLPARVRRRLRDERHRNRPGGLAASLRGAGQGTMPALVDRIGRIAVPTLVVAGALDESGIRRARVIADGVRGARIDIVPAAGHAPHVERPAVFNRLVAEALDRRALAREPRS